MGASVVAAAAVAAAVGSALQKENMIGVRGKVEGRREERIERGRGQRGESMHV